MDNSRKKKTNFSVIYLGSVQILCPVGDGICGSVEEIFENCRIKLKNNLLPKQSLQVKNDSFELCKVEEEDSGTKTVYKFNRIVNCGVDGKRRKILVFNYHHGEGRRDVYLSQAFMCENKSSAKNLALTVAEYFQRVKLVGVQDVEETANDKIRALNSKKDNRKNNRNSNSESKFELGHITSSKQD